MNISDQIEIELAMHILFLFGVIKHQICWWPPHSHVKYELYWRTLVPLHLDFSPYFLLLWWWAFVTGTKEGASSYALCTRVSSGTGPYDKIFVLSPTCSCTISFGAASYSLITSPYHCYCLVSPIPFCIGVICLPARPMLDLSLDTYLYHCSQLPCTLSAVV